MIVNLIQFADSSSGIGALGIDGPALIIQVITFLLAFWALQHWAFKPIVRAMERRRKTIEEGVKLGEQMQKEKTDLDQKVAQTLRKARVEADGIVAEAHDQSRQLVADAEAKAREKGERLIAAAQDRIDQGTTRARRQLEGELVGLISEATEAIVGEKVDARSDAALIDKIMKERAKA